MGIKEIVESIRQIFRLANGSKKTICKLISSKKKNKIRAVDIVIVFFASGLPLVLLTFESISLSQRSFAMHPAPLTTIPPVIINANN